jgi:hypothetical protein
LTNPNKSYIPVKERKRFGDIDNAVPANLRPRNTENQALLKPPPALTPPQKRVLHLLEVATQPHKYTFKEYPDKPVRALSGLRLLRWIGRRMQLSAPDVDAILKKVESIEKRRAELDL